jgi:hypothetical protein
MQTIKMELLEAVFSALSVLRLYNEDTSQVESQSGGSEGSQGRQTVK